MKITIVTDRPKSAISILAVDQQMYSPQHDIYVCPVHPKRPGQDQLRMVDSYARISDVVHVAYWRSGEVLRDRPWWDEKPKVLVHHNPYDLDAGDWSCYDAIVAKNQTQLRALPGSVLIPHCIDLELFSWEDERPQDPPTVGMVAGRIEASKGIKGVAQACWGLGYRFLLVGRLPGKYIQEVEEAAGGKLDFRQDVSAAELVEAYHQMHILAINSKDGFESGPLTALEAMATGTPVVTRNVGMVPDIYNGENMIVREGAQDDVTDLKLHLMELMSDRSRRDSLRAAGYRTVAGRPTQMAARMFSQLYHHVAYQDAPLVSVIVPTCNRADTLPQVLDSIEIQTYPHIEVVICDDNSADDTRAVADGYRQRSRHTVKYVNTRTDGYGLAKARNLGVIEAEGDVLVFLDDRLRMACDAVEWLAKYAGEGGLWVWGVKDDAPKGFVENFSAVARRLVIAGGMFNERIEWYGAMTRDVHKRFSSLGATFQRVDQARAYQVRGSRGWQDRRGDLVQAGLFLHKLYGG